MEKRNEKRSRKAAEKNGMKKRSGETAKRNGKKQEKIEIAKKLLERGEKIEEVVSITGLTKEEVEKLK